MCSSDLDAVYDWEYSSAEVEQIAQRLQRIAATARRTLVIANNHYHGKAVKVVEDLIAYFRRQAEA